jgi:trehalose 6-phosphate synthase/phosphatase
VSGRARETLEEWFGNLPIGLHAEHGLEWRMRPDDPWKSETTAQTWREPVLRILRDYAVRTPGSLVEEKAASLAWHYRAADPEFGEAQARDLRLHLRELLSNAPVELLEGHKVIEVRPYGIHKGALVPRIREALAPGTLLVALGDDRTDEDLFEALPAEALAIHVGAGPTRAPLRLASVAAVRRMLRAVLAPPG